MDRETSTPLLRFATTSRATAPTKFGDNTLDSGRFLGKTHVARVESYNNNLGTFLICSLGILRGVLRVRGQQEAFGSQNKT